ncbi:MAG: hypothetical protein AAF787_19235 [Chloroflexota bacterium]
MADPKHPLNVALAVVGGIGLTLMTIALGVGVVQGADTSTTLVAGLFWTGLVMLIGATAAWIGVAQPYRHFDDINVPQYTGHDHDDDH